MKCLAVSVDRRDHLKLLRKYVSKNAAGKGRAVLEGVELDSDTIQACFQSNPLNDEEAVQAGLITWKDGQGPLPPGKHLLKPWIMQKLHSNILMI